MMSRGTIRFIAALLAVLLAAAVAVYAFDGVWSRTSSQPG